MPELLSAYRFQPLDALSRRCGRMREFAGTLGLRGTVLLAPEGINFSLGGASGALDRWLAFLADEHGIAQPVSNRQAVERVPFLRLKVRTRPEIITFDPAVSTARAGQSLSPAAFNRLLEDARVQLVDTRNDYEVALGSFDGALDPATESFAEFRGWAVERLDPERPVAMFCTGGVRCEKASAWLRAHGYGEVYQLQGGILNYLAEIPAGQSRWHGECFVFDDRVSVDEKLRPSGRPVCAACRHPADGLGEDGMPPVDDDRACRLCRRVFSAGQLAGVRERVRQVALAARRGTAHLGPQAQASDSEGADE